MFFKKIKIINCHKNISKSGIKPTTNFKKGFDSELLFNEKYLKSKMKSYKGKSNFYDDKIPKSSLYTCLSVMLIDSVFKTGNKFYYS